MLDKFFKKKRYWNILPKPVRHKFFSIKYLKKYNTQTGQYYLPLFAFKDSIRNSIIENKIFDEKVFLLMKSLIKQNSIVLDIGSNFGQMSILWSKCQTNVEVYSFEASKFIFEILKKNVELNDANVKVFNSFVCNDVNDEIYIHGSSLKKNSTYGSNKIRITNRKKNTDKISSLKIDQLKFDKPISAMKIDVQGYDLDVLKGAKETIKKYRMPIIFEYEKEFEKELNYTFVDFQKFIEEIKYKISSKIDESNYLIEEK
tara:strand:+ start:243 stop:1016 length:774 start_codon:yes stop_codon:yes gene_type:complete